ncbi:DinB family protein [Marinoscillum sp. 108]|jgi:hypothetical protein|uniref:DinB family protein n=1 Tax=Marinoscillum sp. 108 TaxID=2653151 RepID=UPI0012EF6A9B|nr:DinB family protein [Marinoscillum sp. 108]VXD18671.1 conserved hypothetical protein [Marinoscillum sp. 108]
MPINQSAINLLDQVKYIVRQMTSDQYVLPISTLSNATIGQHVRHLLEFFLCLQDAQLTRSLDYDDRKHDQYLQTDVKLALGVTNALQNTLQQQDKDFPIAMRANYDIEVENSIDISTSFFRELAYNIEHAIHHMALIKIGLREAFPEVDIPEHFGVASSTVRYQKSQNT